MARLSDSITYGNHSITGDANVGGTLTIGGVVFSAVSLTGGTNVTVSGTYPNFTISSSYVNTTYSAGTGISLSGTTFNVDNPFNPSGSYTGLRAQATTKGDVGLGSVPNVDATNASNLSSGTVPLARLPDDIGGGLKWTVTASNITASKSNGYLVDCSAGARTITLPPSPVEGDSVGVSDFTKSSETNTITIARNGSNITGLAENLTVSINGAGFILVYTNAVVGWEIVSEVGISDQYVPYTYDVSDNMTTKADLTVTGTLTENSSIRYKTNVRQIEDPLNSILKLTGVMYDKDNSHDNTGFIAEEVNKVIPNVVSEKDGQVEGIKYTQIIAYLVESMKEMNGKIERLEKGE